MEILSGSPAALGKLSCHRRGQHLRGYEQTKISYCRFPPFIFIQGGGHYVPLRERGDCRIRHIAIPLPWWWGGAILQIHSAIPFEILDSLEGLSALELAGTPIPSPILLVIRLREGIGRCGSTLPNAVRQLPRLGFGLRADAPQKPSQIY